MLHMDNTLDEGDDLVIFDELELKTPPSKCRSRVDDFYSKFRCRQAADNEFPACLTGDGQRRQSKQTRTRLRSRFRDLTLFNISLLKSNF